MIRTKRTLCQSILVLWAIALAPGVMAQVQIKTAAKSLSLPHVMATRFVGADGTAKIHLLFASSKPEGVILTDAFGDPGFTLAEWLKKSGATAAKIEFGEKEPQQFSLNTFNIGGQDMALGGVQLGDDNIGIFKKLELKQDRVTGLLQYEGPPGTLTGGFESAIRTLKEPPVTKGAHVEKSPQARALLSFVTAMNKLDLASAAPFIVGDLEKDMGEMRSRMGDTAVRGMIEEDFGAPKELKKRLSSPEAEIAEADDSAKIWLPPAKGESQKKRFSFVRIDGRWKVYW